MSHCSIFVVVCCCFFAFEEQKVCSDFEFLWFCVRLCWPRCYLSPFFMCVFIIMIILSIFTIIIDKVMAIEKKEERSKTDIQILSHPPQNATLGIRDSATTSSWPLNSRLERKRLVRLWWTSSSRAQVSGSPLTSLLRATLCQASPRRNTPSGFMRIQSTSGLPGWRLRSSSASLPMWRRSRSGPRTTQMVREQDHSHLVLSHVSGPLLTEQSYPD